MTFFKTVWHRRASLVMPVVALAFGNAGAQPAAQSKPNPKATAEMYVPADNCKGDPKWLTKNGISRKTQFDTTRSDPVGLSIVDDNGKGGTRRGAHRSWSIGGYLGRLVNDQEGHIYAYPVPIASLDLNPIEKSNILYQIDTESMVMAPFVEIPKSVEGAVSNPFGIVATAYECSSRALYVATLYGSTASEQRGLIARVDTATKAVRVLKRGLDATAIAVVFGGDGKRLVVGTARDNQVISFGLTESGDIKGEPRLEIELEGFETAREKVARVIRFDTRGGLYVRSVPFDYTLAARTTIPMAELHFRPVERGGFELQRESLGQLGGAPPPASPNPTR